MRQCTRNAAEAGGSCCCLRASPRPREIRQQLRLLLLQEEGLLAAASAQLPRQHQQQPQLRLPQRQQDPHQQPGQQRQQQGYVPQQQQQQHPQHQQQQRRYFVSPAATCRVAQGYCSSFLSNICVDRCPAPLPASVSAATWCGTAAESAAGGAPRAAEAAFAVAAASSRVVAAKGDWASDRISRTAAECLVTPGIRPAAAAARGVPGAGWPAAAATGELAAAAAAGAPRKYTAATRPARHPAAAAPPAAVLEVAEGGGCVASADNTSDAAPRLCRHATSTYPSTSNRCNKDRRQVFGGGDSMHACVSACSSWSCSTSCCSSSSCCCCRGFHPACDSTSVICFCRRSLSTSTCSNPTCCCINTYNPTSTHCRNSKGCCSGPSCRCNGSYRNPLPRSPLSGSIQGFSGIERHCSRTPLHCSMRKLRSNRRRCISWTPYILRSKMYYTLSSLGGSTWCSFGVSSHHAFGCGSRQCSSSNSSNSRELQPLRDACGSSSSSSGGKVQPLSDACGCSSSSSSSSSAGIPRSNRSRYYDGSRRGAAGICHRTINNSSNSCNHRRSTCTSWSSSRRCSSACSMRSNTGIWNSCGHSSRDRRRGVPQPLPVVGLLSVSTSACFSGGQTQPNIFGLPSLSSAEKARASQPNTAQFFTRTLGHALVLRRQELQQEEPQEQQQHQRKFLEETLLQGPRRNTIPRRREGPSAAVAELALPRSGFAAAAGQQLPSAKKEGISAIQAAASTQEEPPASPAPQSLQVRTHEKASPVGAAIATGDRSVLREEDQQQKLHPGAEKHCIQLLPLRQEGRPFVEDKSLARRVNTEALLWTQQEQSQQQHTRREEQEEKQRQQQKEQQQQRMYRPRQSEEQHALPLVGQELLRAIKQLPWARRLKASLDSAAAGEGAPYIEGAGGEAEAAGVAATTGERVAAARPAAGEAGGEAGGEAAGEAAVVAGGEMSTGDTSCRRSGTHAAAEASAVSQTPCHTTTNVSAAAQSASAAAFWRGSSETAEAVETEVPAGVVDSAAEWWRRHAPRYLGPVIKRISKRPADVQLRLIQLALTHTPLQEQVCAPERQQLQQQAQLLRLRGGGGADALLKRHQQHVRCMRHGRGGSSTDCSRGGRGRDPNAEETAGDLMAEETASDRAEAETGDTVPAGVDGISEEDVIIFGAPFLWFTQDPRLPQLHRFWCVEQLAFWLHASGRPSALRQLFQRQQQQLKPPGLRRQQKSIQESQVSTSGEAAPQQQHHHHYPRMQVEQEYDKKQPHCSLVHGEGCLTSPAAFAGDAQLLAGTSWNEGCFQLSPQGDLQISDIRVWRNIGLTIKHLLREGYIDSAAHTLYSLLSLLYDARAFPAPAAAATARTSTYGRRAEAVDLLHISTASGAAPAFPTVAAAASRCDAQGAADPPAVLAEELSEGVWGHEGVAVAATTSTAVGSLSAIAAAASETAELLHADDSAGASVGGAAVFRAAVGTSAAALPCSAITTAGVHSGGLVATAAAPAGVSAATVSANAASSALEGENSVTRGSTLGALGGHLAACQEKLPVFPNRSSRGLTAKNTTETGDGNSYSVTEARATRITEENGDISCLDNSASRPFTRRTHDVRETGTTSDTYKRSSTTPPLPVKVSCSSRSASVEFLPQVTPNCDSATVADAPAERDTERLARHLGLTRWSISKPVWLKLLARRQRLSSSGENNDRTAKQQDSNSAALPLQEHELEALALLESLFFMFHDEVACAAKVMAEALDEQQAAAERAAGVVPKQETDTAFSAGCHASSCHSTPLCSDASMATSRRLSEKFTAAGQASAGRQGHMQHRLSRLRIVKVAVQSAVGEKSQQQQRPVHNPFASGDEIGQTTGVGGRRWVAALLPSSEAAAQTQEIFVPQICRETVASPYHVTLDQNCTRCDGQNEEHGVVLSGSNCSIDTVGENVAAQAAAARAREAVGAATAAAAEQCSFGLRTLVWYLRLQSHFYKVQSVPFTTFVCRLLTRLLRLCELQRLYPAESNKACTTTGASPFSGSTGAAVSAAAKPLSLFAKRETLPLPFSPTATATASLGALGPLQDGVIVSRLAPSARDATMATPGAVLLAQILEAVKAVHFYDHELLRACCEALRPNVCLLPSQYACGVIFNLGCLGYSDPALASAVGHYLVDSGLLKTATKVDAMMQLLIGFSRLDFRDDRLTFACIDALMAMPDVLSSTCRPVSLFYLLHSISFHNVRCLPLLAKLLPALQRFANVVPTNVAVLTFHDLVRNSVWPGPYRRLLVPRLLKELPSLAVATLAGATPLCWSLWGHFDVPLLLQLVQQFNTTRNAGSNRSLYNAEPLRQTHLNGDREICQQNSEMASRRGSHVIEDAACERDAQPATIRCLRGEQDAGGEETARGGDTPTTLTLVKASTQFWSAFYCVQLLALTPRDISAQVQAVDKQYTRSGFKQRKSQRRAKDRDAPLAKQVLGCQRPVGDSSVPPCSSTVYDKKNAGKPPYQVASPVSVYFIAPHLNPSPNVRFSPWQAGSLAGLKAAKILQIPEANWTPKSSTLHEEVLAACPHKVRAAAINEQPAGPYEVDLVVPPGVVASRHADFTERKRRSGGDTLLHYSGSGK